jgi:hypothetical protein
MHICSVFNGVGTLLDLRLDLNTVLGVLRLSTWDKGAVDRGGE